MKKILLAFLTVITLTAAAQEKVVSDPNAQQRSLSSSFTGISVSSGIDLYLTQGNEEAVAVSATEQKYLERLKTEVENGVLKIYYDAKNISWGISDKKKLKAYVSFKTLERLTISSGAEVVVNNGLKVNTLQMKCSSGGTFDGKVTAEELIVDQSSGAEVTISGTVNKLNVEVSSGAIFQGYGLATDYCDAKATSGGGVRVTINKELNAKANSGGGIRYKGNGVIRDMDVSSGGIVKKS
jgi:cytoskeletal protein CcmA (bactofilin family)